MFVQSSELVKLKHRIQKTIFVILVVTRHYRACERSGVVTQYLGRRGEKKKKTGL